MRVISILVAGALAAAACGGAAQPSPAPTVARTASPVPTVAPTPTPVAKVTFDITPMPANEVPPVTNDEKVITCKATVVFDLTRDASAKIMAAKASVDISFANLPAGTAILIGHIHGPGAAGTSAGVKVPFKTDSENPLPVTSGAASFKKADVTVEPDLATQILDKPTDWYLNFHSKLNPGGMCRAQLKSA
jgi:hypothetical protein